MIPPNFVGAALPRSADIYDQIAERLRVPVVTFRAFLITEVASESGFTEWRWPQELFERHKFHFYTNGAFDKSAPDISYPERGGYLRQPSEHHRLCKAAGLALRPALLSTSWGMAQLMGFNYGVCGYADPEAMVEAMCESEDKQLWAFANFLIGTGIDEDLRDDKIPDAIAKYNGTGNVPDYLRKWRANLAKLTTTVNYQDSDDRADNASVQAMLNLLGYGPLTVDGYTGPLTKQAVIAFQKDNGLLDDGIAGPKTKAALYSAMPKPSAKPLNI